MAAPRSCMEFAGNARRASPVGSTAAWDERLLCGHPPLDNWLAASSSVHRFPAYRVSCMGRVV